MADAPQAPAAPALGAVLINTFPAFRARLTGLLVVIVAIAAVAVLVRRPPSTVGEAAVRAAAIAGVAIVLAPAARAGYMVYPIDLAVWGWLLIASTPDRLDDRALTSRLRPWS